MAKPMYERTRTTTVIELLSLIGRMDALNQNNPYLAYVMVVRFIKNIIDVSGQLYWREQSRLELKHYYVKNGQLRHETLLHFVMNYSLLFYSTLKNQSQEMG